MTLRFHTEAAAELDAALDWYQEVDGAAAARLVSEIRRRVFQAERLPASGPRVAGIAARFEARAFTLHGFPYRVITASVRSERVVIALAHTSRRPGYWRARLR